MNTALPVRIAAAVLATSALAACDMIPKVEFGSPTARATLQARSGSTVSGTVTFAQMGSKVRIVAQVAGLTPGEHGFHLHEAGDCSAPDAMSAKGHFNPAGTPHGPQSGAHHAGDVPNLLADGAGAARLVVDVEGLTVDAGPNGVIGRAVVVHADPDDYRSQPAGNSGKRVACGVVAKL